MASGDICFVVTASYTRTVNSLLPPGTLEEGGPPGRCDGSTCTYLLKSSVPCSPGDHYLWSFQQAAGVGVLSPLCRRGHVSGRVAFGPRPLPPWPCVCVCVKRCLPREVACQPPRGLLSPGWVELVPLAAAVIWERTETTSVSAFLYFSGSTSVRTWGLGRRKECFLLGRREAFPARSPSSFMPGFQLAAGDVIPVGKALGVNRVAGTRTSVAVRDWDGSLWVPVRQSLSAFLKNHFHSFLKQIANLFRIHMQRFTIFVAELF